MPVPRLTAKELARHIDHTNLAPDVTTVQIVTLCAEARQHGFAAVCVNPAHVATAAAELRATSVAVCGVVGFPTGAHETQIKVAEAVSSVRNGAREIDMVAHAGWLKDGDVRRYVEDIRAVRYAIGDVLILKVIIEASLLEPAQIERAALLAVEGGANFVKTSTGVYGRARLEDVRLLRRILPPHIKIKAAGGIRTYETACAFIAAGAERIGTSCSMSIVRSVS
ncbi:MAG: deoxyribose-phosphate aldolase [Candidatus Zixiibacteriota bacterium]